jgi:RecA-family ATPase
MVEQIDRLESAIERLADISTDLKAMLAAHEQRLNQSEKDTSVLFKLAENRRKEYDTKIDEVYTHMNEKDDKILAEIKAHREASAKEHESLSKRITVLEKYIWLAIGGATVISSIMPYLIKMMFGH